MDKLNETEAINLEKKHVYEIYDKIADSFSDSRYRAWPNVKKFIENLPNGTLLLDIGTGNGKNLNLNKNIFSVGCDTSLKLIEICKNNNYECLTSNVLNLPFKNNCFDVCIFIAVLHHLSTKQRRLKAIENIINLLNLNGQCLIYVWAFEQELSGNKSDYIKKKYNENFGDLKYAEIENDNQIINENSKKTIPIHYNGTDFKFQDCFVPWKQKNVVIPLEKQDLRFYHLFKQNELEELIKSFDNVEITKSYYDNGNWAVLFKKTSI